MRPPHPIAFLLALILAPALLASRAAGAVDVKYEGSIGAFLHQNFDRDDVCMVVALVDEDGTRILSAGKLGTDAGNPATGDTLFEIGSCTKTFTALLLQDMARRGEVKLDDPVSKYLPAGVKVPSRNGKQITLVNLAAQDSGLPFNATNHVGADWFERFASYTVPDLYEFLSGYSLTQDPGAAFGYSNVGMGLLGHALSLRAGASYESLVTKRICRPLGMSSTCITVPPPLEPRVARGHDDQGRPAPPLRIDTLAGAGAIRSSANDLAKYVAANLALAPSELAPLMRDMQVVRHHTGTLEWGNTAMPWVDLAAYNPPGSDLTGHAGSTGAFSAFIGLDKQRRRGVVVLSNQVRIHSTTVGFRILQRARLEGVDAVTMKHLQQVTGVGFVLDLDKPSRMPLVKAAQPKSPAARANIAAGSIIESIDGVPTAGKTLLETSALIRGDAGTPVRLALKAPGKAEPKTVTLTREQFLVGE